MANLDIDRHEPHQVWDTERAFQHFHALGKADTKRTAERYLHTLGILPVALTPAKLVDELGRPANQSVLHWALAKARRQRKLVLFVQLHDLKGPVPNLHANDARGARYWVPLIEPIDTPNVVTALQRLQEHAGKEIAVFPCGALVGLLRDTDSLPHVSLSPTGYAPILTLRSSEPAPQGHLPPYLKQLEAESIHRIREAVAGADNPVMLYSGDQDSTVMLHLVRKAFYPAPPPLTLMQTAPPWPSQEMVLFREHMAQSSGMNVRAQADPDTLTQSGRQAQPNQAFDIVLGAGRRAAPHGCTTDPAFSLSSPDHNPTSRQPGFWHLTPRQKNPGESVHLSPLSNWTELDTWHYLYHSAIPVASVYFAKKRPVVFRDGGLILVDDDKQCCLLPGEDLIEKQVRFRTGMIASNASTVAEIILELHQAISAETQARATAHALARKPEKKNRRQSTHEST